MSPQKNPEIFKGEQHKDSRGILTYFNTFNLDVIKRFYIIDQPDLQTVRAWQGHKKEQKWFHVISGSFKVVLVRPDNWESPSEDLKCEEIELYNDNIQILNIPGGYANGFKALMPNSRLLIFSDFSAEESLNDDFRFDKDKWYNWV